MSPAPKSSELHKVAILCTRPGPELLVFHQDRGGVQVPAGTVEQGEDIAAGAIRELAEESGVVVPFVTHLFSLEESWDTDEMVVVEDVPLYLSPDIAAPILIRSLMRALVRVKGPAGIFMRAAREEWDLDSAPPICTASTEGFVLSSALRPSQQRHLFHAQAPGDVCESWEIFAEGQYTFRCFWKPLGNTGLIEGHRQWVERARPLLEIRLLLK